MEYGHPASVTCESCDSLDVEEPVCPRSPKRRPFKMLMHAIPAHERLDLHGDFHLDALSSSPKKPHSEERKDRSGPKMSLFDFMELRQLSNKRKISL